ncbi:hypothetical protein ACGFRB_09480 [Streptomyces sp. NPDC048718]|uniref:hypothetical protein n=1 Tax=Streptomyces sp. NPDC048718 TaxID=3365587 RepID=UPI00371F9217
MTRHPDALDPVIPRFCAQTGASLPLAWELAWSEPDRTGETVLRLAPPPAPRELDRLVWPRRLPAGVVLRTPRGVRVQETPVPFLEDGDAVTVLFGTEPPAFAEVPRPVGALLAEGATAAAVRERWGGDEEAVDHLLVGLLRLGLLASDPAPGTADVLAAASADPANGPLLVREAWTRAVEREPGTRVLAALPTGNFLKVGEAALRLWRGAGTGTGAGAGTDGGVPYGSLPERLHALADRMLLAGMLRAVTAG